MKKLTFAMLIAGALFAVAVGAQQAQQAVMFSMGGSAAVVAPPTGMSVWYSADCITYSSSVCSVPATGTAITAWADRSGNANNLTKATGTCTFNTAQINTQPAVTFASCGFSMASGIGTGTGTYTMFVVMKRSSTTGKGDFSSCSPSTQGCFKYHTGDTSKIEGVDSAGNAMIGLGTAAPDTSWHQLNTKVAAGTGVTFSLAFRLGRSADPIGSSTSNTGFSNPVKAIGYDAQNNNEFFAGQIAELILYNYGLTGTDITQAEAYLNTKYGL